MTDPRLWILAAAIIALCATRANAQQRTVQQMCAPRDVMIANLERSYEEQPSARGLSATGNLVELLVSPSGSWTMLMTRPNGITCVIGVGESWHDIQPRMSNLSDPVS